MKTLTLVFAALTLTACGQTGAQGPVGQQGTAPSVIPVQLCPGFTPVYPSTFPESALCIDGQLYGVYSANGGFLSLLPDGDYSSNGINATCNLTIIGCSVAQQ